MEALNLTPVEMLVKERNAKYNLDNDINVNEIFISIWALFEDEYHLILDEVNNRIDLATVINNQIHGDYEANDAENAILEAKKEWVKSVILEIEEKERLA